MKFRRFRLALVVLACSHSWPGLAATWVHTQTLLPSAAGDVDMRFGKTIAADRYPDGTLRALYVGAPNATVTVGPTAYFDAGKVYVFTPGGGWHLSTTIAGPAQNGAHFGATLAVAHGAVVVGAPDYDYPGGIVDSGAVYIYEDRNADDPSQPEPAIQTVTFRASQTAGNRTGFSVAVDGDGFKPGSSSFVAWGSPYDNDKGCIRVERMARDVQEYQGVGCATNTGENLGASVGVRALNASTFIAVAGAPGVTQNGQMLAGATYLYVAQSPLGGNLLKLDTLQAPTPAFLDAFGASVALDATRIYVGATGRTKNGTGRTGSVSVFAPSGIIGYSFDTELFPGAGASAGDLCGAALAVEPDVAGRVVMGCPSHDGLLTNEGALRVFTLGSFAGNPFWFQDLVTMSDLPHGADDMGRSAVRIGDVLYAGAPLSNVAGTDNGAVQRFATDTIFRDGFE